MYLFREQHLASWQCISACQSSMTLKTKRILQYVIKVLCTCIYESNKEHTINTRQPRFYRRNFKWRYNSKSCMYVRERKFVFKDNKFDSIHLKFRYSGPKTSLEQFMSCLQCDHISSVSRDVLYLPVLKTARI